MSVSCWIVYADRVVTRMTVWDDMPNSLHIGRALTLSHYAYVSRMGRPPPQRDITIAGKIYRLPHILGLRYQYVDGNGSIGTISEGQLTKDLLFGMALMGNLDMLLAAP
jgi:hypothetical protein